MSTPPDTGTPRKINLDEAARLIEALELDLARARSDSSRVAALRAEVEQLRATLGVGDPADDDVHQGLTGLHDLMHRLGDELVSDAIEASRYITQIGRIIGL